LAQAIHRRAEPLSFRLGAKVSVVVDGGGQISLAALKCDIRLTACGSGQWIFSAGEGDAERLSEDEAVDRTASVLEQLAFLGQTARAADLAYQAAGPVYAEAPPPVGKFVLRNGNATGIALPFGSAKADTIERLANIARDAGVASYRLAPQHGILAIDANPAFVARAMELGLIANRSDPRLRVSACIGSEGCASGHIPSRLLAERLAPTLKAGDHLHVSGCGKGCAHPRRAELTIVGRSDGHGLVIDGKAGDTPQAILSADQLESALAAR
jgi:precorrin-3B synthase